MSTYEILLKIKADTEEEALDTAEELLESSIEENYYGYWESVREVTPIKASNLKEYNVKSFEELESYYNNLTHKNKEYYVDALQKIIETHLAEKHLTKEDIPLAIHNSLLKNKIEAILKEPKEIKPIKITTLQEKVTLILDTILSHYSMIGYNLKHIEEINDYLSDPINTSIALGSIDVRFYEQIDNDEGEYFYFLGSRKG